MKPFASNEEFFLAFQDLTDRIEKDGNENAAAELRKGFSGLNGLTDGWALLMDSIQMVLTAEKATISQANHTELSSMLHVAKRVVSRE